ncbi:MAG: LLM class flavin-dependent oxidoreductase [Thermoleophilia bacterium]|nr:LLM class flavin-dependent oxidoreductase [Thermoleophilia bacterium]MDH3724869.1 LLM class flavin-dependent oxidoreductase [Thermoleophilia bacterium]
MSRLRFGTFLAPFHTPGDSPHLGLHRDLELIARLDELGFDEAWVGEHHSTGWETIASPEVFLAAAAERTRHIRLGTGAVSLPYHHPLMVADRIVLLDHLTRGRLMFGVGPGGHLSDALMLGLDPSGLRSRMAEAIEVILRLFTEVEPLSITSDWFEMHDAVLQLRPYSDPYPPLAFTSMESPAGMQLAGRYGAGVLSLAVAKGPRGPIDLAAHWRIAEEVAAENGTEVSRSEWRLAIPVYVAETRQEALDHVREGAASYLIDYAEAITGRSRPVSGPREQIVDRMVEAGSWIVGTPDDAVAAIQGLQERSGGFGGLLIWANEWTTRENTLRSYELIARNVAPHFQGALEGIFASERVARGMSQEMSSARTAGVEKAQARFESERAG